jgi:hypothetical protein
VVNKALAGEFLAFVLTAKKAKDNCLSELKAASV